MGSSTPSKSRSKARRNNSNTSNNGASVGNGNESSSNSNSNSNAMSAGGFGPELKARIFLLVACLWPLWVLALFGASSPSQEMGNQVASPTAVVAKATTAAATTTRLQSLRGVLDRVDVMGYGPTHPRIAVVVVGEEPEYLTRSVESIIRNTDLNRIFLITAVLDGHQEGDTSSEKLVRDLKKIDAGSIPHWHGPRPDIHFPGSKPQKVEDEDDDDPHGRKIHVMFNEERQGVASSRLDAVEFIQLLQTKHEAAGLKSPEEDLLLVLLQAGSQLVDYEWLSPVTSALIVPPPLLGIHNPNVALKLANAVSFHLEGPGKRTSFDEQLMPIVKDATAADINLSSGQSYPTPALNGAAMAMRLDTFLHLPAQDPSLMDPWPANLDLAMNLWLCADGIDTVPEAKVTSLEEFMITDSNNKLPPSLLDQEMAARFAAVWMDDKVQQQFFQAYSSTITRLDWETKMTRAKQEMDFPKDMPKKCRSFEWYIQEVNSDISKILEQTAWDHQQRHAEEQEAAKTTAKAKAKAKAKPVVKVRAPVVEVVRVTKKEEASPLKVEEVNHEEHHEPPKDKEEESDDAELSSESDSEGESESESESQNENGIPNLAKDDRQKPAVPLRPENVEIVQKAKPIDITFVDIGGGHKDFPHMGAKDENGNWGYVHDEAALHNNPPPLTWDDGQERKACSMRDNNFRMMTERVVVDMDYDKKMQTSGAKRDKIFCLVYTIESGHHKIPSILETWGSKCDGFMVGSTKTDPSIGAVEIPHEGPEEYDNIWQKVRSMWGYIYDNYYEKYDWFHIGGDDLFLLVENLRMYLESEEIRTAANGGIYLPDGTETTQTPLLLGRRFAYQGDMNNIFDSGGSGYTMNKAALKALVVDGFPNYFPHAHTFSEDTMVAKVFRKMGVFPYDTKDDDGGERYMPFLPGHHWNYRLPKGTKKDWYGKYSINIKEGKEHCTPNSVAFHYVKDQMMKRLFELAYKLCPDEYMQI